MFTQMSSSFRGRDIWVIIRHLDILMINMTGT